MTDSIKHKVLSAGCAVMAPPPVRDVNAGNKTPLYRNKEWLREQYLILGKSTNKIGEEYKIAPSTIYKWLVKFNIPRRTFSESCLLKHSEVDLGFDCHRTKKNNIYISTKSLNDFLDYIGPCPIICYQYKWKYNK